MSDYEYQVIMQYIGQIDASTKVLLDKYDIKEEVEPMQTLNILKHDLSVIPEAVENTNYFRLTSYDINALSSCSDMQEVIKVLMYITFMSEEQFADLMGVSKNTAYYWITGRSSVPKIAAKYLSQLIFDKPNVLTDKFYNKKGSK